ncbi:Hydroxyquinol 1,2-dioxygenase [Candidatus Terasakiella magnetica]|uniref:Hydroxyquinol 1,2-dioxygenase n=1 Tax=Candidatus Terasakiella magnetica TaxID=1867952 RepID=A0A1C3RFF9_9PROT|nr:intradiol ring-cleavage dioxygenase [Candidatus Terasakiella magnetica]SCA56020.1 Hydroxyquinol 1,2-dioxygenase [Candidatus Terasakiella magnetica]
MVQFTAESHLKEAVKRLQNSENPRLKEVMTAFSKHMFAFINEVQPSEEEWMTGIQFLTELGQTCNDVRQEWILFSDAFGVTMLMDYINHHKEQGSTESSVLGPFYRERAPVYEKGDSISQDHVGEETLLRGRVTDRSGKPIVGASLDVWQTAPNGMYEVQDENQPDFNLRGLFKTDENGEYEIRTVKPVSYPIPDDGPVGKLLGAVGRHPYRPAHIHFIVNAAGKKPIITQLFTKGDEYLSSDAVFGVKDSLVVDYVQKEDGYQVEYDFVLEDM